MRDGAAGKAARKRMTTVAWRRSHYLKGPIENAERVACQQNRLDIKHSNPHSFRGGWTPKVPRKFIIRLRFIIFVVGVLSAARLPAFLLFFFFIYSFMSFIFLYLCFFCFCFAFFLFLWASFYFPSVVFCLVDSNLEPDFSGFSLVVIDYY